MQTAISFQFNVFDMMPALIYSRDVHPCSKSRTYDEVIPRLYEKYSFSLSQLYSGLKYIDSEYEKIIEIYIHQIPVGMKIYPRNESEKPFIRKVIDGQKQRNNISGRTIQVADKGLNCADNIYHALKEKDGYIFLKSVKQLPETEKIWISNL